MQLGEKIQEIRESKSISQRELAKLSSVPQATLSKIENNTTKINIDTLEKIANGLNMSSFKILYLAAADDVNLSPGKKDILLKLKPLIEKLDLTLTE
jgi:transcriptional regulator with XRE-family HTH domain